ncbi:TIM44-like domain-containing protein [Candidatus Saccharibacteria bacterium]|nr:TIM44-like domain-containing protein [Candidatus Saccharibacteria bacterium]MCL1962702.1 TIM44-like domain-containing protein [Candidatus Saccharibacteria bacterium]
MLNLILFLQLFARAGGGGSGGGSGGGGGGVGTLFMLLGYVPMHLLGRAFRRRKNYHKNDKGWWQGMQVLTWIIGLIFTVVLVMIAIITIYPWFIISAGGAIAGTCAGLYNLFGKIKRSKREEEELKKAGWDEITLTDGAKRVFMAYQNDWSHGNVASMANYLTPRYYEHAKLMMMALEQMKRANDMSNVIIEEALIVSVDDQIDDSKDTFVVGFTAKAQDRIVDVSVDYQTLYTDKSEFVEYWKFQRTEKGFMLDGIQPTTANEWSRNPTLESFAAQNGMYFSLDWGWLLLPRRGQLFSGGAFGKSDINNHCIGLIQGTYDKILTQIYTYSQNPEYANTYLIAQATLPKSYGDIVVRQRTGIWQSKIKGLHEVSTEWGDFNKLYRVFATSPEQATSLELLSPKFMEQLTSVPFEINIEVVDNVVYIYTPLGGLFRKKPNDAQFQSYDMEQKYRTMLWALQSAFKEMKM